MKSVYESIMTGLNEAIEDAQSEGKKLNRRTVTIIPVKEYGAEQVRNIRNSVGMSQSTFAGYLGAVSYTHLDVYKRQGIFSSYDIRQ